MAYPPLADFVTTPITVLFTKNEKISPGTIIAWLKKR